MQSYTSMFLYSLLHKNISNINISKMFRVLKLLI